MMNKPENISTSFVNREKENFLSRIVVESFGNWSDFRRIIKDARENVDYNPLENKFSQRRFINGILGSYADKIPPADFEKLSSLIKKEINALERRKKKTEMENKERGKSAKEKYIQQDMPFGDGEDS